MTTETVQRLTIAPSHDNLVKRVRINVLIAPIIDQEIGLLLKSVNNILDAIIREVDLLSSRSSLHDVFSAGGCLQRIVVIFAYCV